MNRHKKDYKNLTELVNTIKPEYLAILRKKKAVKRYVANLVNSCKKEYQHSNVKAFILWMNVSQTDFYNFLTGSFQFPNTPEGADFWHKIANSK